MTLVADNRNMNVHPDLLAERKCCSFIPEELTNFLDGGKKATEEKRKTWGLFCNDKSYETKVPTYHMSHSEVYDFSTRNAFRSIRVAAKNNLLTSGDSIRELVGSTLTSYVNSEGTPLAVHYVMFIPCITGQATDEQGIKWLEGIFSGDIIGTYAQTELGHGTFIRGLETTATYDPETEEFVIHSPTLTSAKWWPGALGKTANHCIVMAQLYTQGKCHGIHPFMVQIRDINTHRSLPGITVGAIGPKMGLNGNDNGYLVFDHVRIPRENMLMKHAQVSPNGTYNEPVHEKLNYGTMVFVRTSICLDIKVQLAKAVTIATRFSIIRRQGDPDKDGVEPQIIDYRTQQYKIFSQVALAYALHFAAEYLWDVYNNVQDSMQSGDLARLPELHSLSCCLKAISSNDTSRGIETLRLGCGGHGYISSSNLPRLYCQATAACTYEGDNTVLLLQTARHLIKSYNQACHHGEKLPGFMSYLSEPITPRLGSILNRNQLVLAYRQVAAGVTAATSDKLEKLSRVKPAKEVWNDLSIQLVRCAEMHCRYFIAAMFVEGLTKAELSDAVKSVLLNLCDLHLYYWVLKNSGEFIRYAGLSGTDISIIQDAVPVVLEKIRPDVVGLTDAFDYPDEILSSTLGCWDGQVYERLFEEAKKNPLNQVDVPDAFYKYIKPYQNSSKL